jgi:hypothetical protein
LVHLESTHWYSLPKEKWTSFHVLMEAQAHRQTHLTTMEHQQQQHRLTPTKPSPAAHRDSHTNPAPTTT